ncbi:MAG TPA: hypothetical protein DCS37_02145 [Clostridiales bacterium]|nr:hypothetical protein [Clostridiales bacterium]
MSNLMSKIRFFLMSKFWIPVAVNIIDILRHFAMFRHFAKVYKSIFIMINILKCAIAHMTTSAQ